MRIEVAPPRLRISGDIYVTSPMAAGPVEILRPITEKPLLFGKNWYPQLPISQYSWYFRSLGVTYKDGALVFKFERYLWDRITQEFITQENNGKDNGFMQLECNEGNVFIHPSLPQPTLRLTGMARIGGDAYDIVATKTSSTRRHVGRVGAIPHVAPGLNRLWRFPTPFAHRRRRVGYAFEDAHILAAILHGGSGDFPGFGFNDMSDIRRVRLRGRGCQYDQETQDQHSACKAHLLVHGFPSVLLSVMKALTTEATVYCAQTHNQKRIKKAARHSGTVSAQAQISEHGRLNRAVLHRGPSLARRPAGDFAEDFAIESFLICRDDAGFLQFFDALL
jgi:hypothetical protein